MPTNQSHEKHAPHWELAKMQEDLGRLLSSADALGMSTSERRIAITRLQQKLETWTQKYKVPSSIRPTTLDEVSLHLAFLGTRIRVLDSVDNTGDVAQPSSAQILYDARLSCLLVATSCNHQLNQALMDRLDRLLDKTTVTNPEGAGTHSSSTPLSLTSASFPSFTTSCSATGAPQQICHLEPPLSNPSFDQAQVSALLPFHRLTNVFPIAAVFVLARHILAIDERVQSSQYALRAAQNNEQRQQEIDQDISLLEALLFCFHNAPPPATAVACGKVDSTTHGSRLGRTIQHLLNIIRAIVCPIGGGGVDDADDGNDEYASEALLAPTSSLVLDASSNAIGVPDLGFYGSGACSPSQIGLSSSSSSSLSRWAASQDSTSSSVTPLFTTQSSIYPSSIAPTPPTIADPPFDISQYLHQMDTSSPIIWDYGQGQVELQMQQQAQSVPETTKRRSRKRARKDSSQDQDRHSVYKQELFETAKPFEMQS